MVTSQPIRLSNNFITLKPDLTFTELRVVSTKHFQWVWLASRERLPFRTPGSSPFLGLICGSIVETRFLDFAVSLLDFSPWIPLGTLSILLCLNYMCSRWFCKPPPPFWCSVLLYLPRQRVAVARYRMICLVMLHQRIFMGCAKLPHIQEVLYSVTSENFYGLQACLLMILRIFSCIVLSLFYHSMWRYNIINLKFDTATN